jgi:hypothetical protein
MNVVATKFIANLISFGSLDSYIPKHVRQTPQLAKSTIHYSMRRHLKSRFQMLRHKRLNEVIAQIHILQMKNQLKAITVCKYFLE